LEAGGEAEGDGQTLLTIEDPACCLRQRQGCWYEGEFPNVALMEAERSTVKLAGRISCCYGEKERWGSRAASTEMWGSWSCC